MPYLILLLCVMTVVSRGQGVDTIPIPTSRDVMSMQRSGNAFYAWSFAGAERVLYRRTLDTPWKRLAYAPTSADLLYVDHDTIRCIESGHLRESTDGGASWTSRSLIEEVGVLIGRGRIGIRSFDCEDGTRTLLVYDILADTVRYLRTDLRCLGPLTIIESSDALWLAVQSSAGPAVYRIDDTSTPISTWSLSLVHVADHIMRMNSGGVGVWTFSEMRADDSPDRVMRVPFDPLDIGYPTDVLYDQGAWWFTRANGLYRSEDGRTWERQSAVSALAPFRCWSIMGDTLLLSRESSGPFLWLSSESRAVGFADGMLDVDPSIPLAAIGDRVCYSDVSVDPYRSGIMAWGDDVPRPIVIKAAYTGVWKRRVVPIDGRFWTIGQSPTISYDPMTLAERVEHDGRPSLGIVTTGSHVVLWQDNGLVARPRGTSGSWQPFVDDLGEDRFPVGILGMIDRVIVIYALSGTNDELYLVMRAYDTSGVEIIGDRLIDQLDPFARLTAMTCARIGTSAVVWLQDAMYVSEDGGITWMRRPIPFANATWPSIAGDAALVWSGDRRGVWQTTDVGYTWTMTSVPDGITSVYSVAATTRHLHLLTPDGILRVPRSLTHVGIAEGAPTGSVRLIGSAITVSAAAPFTMTLVDVRGRVVATTTEPQMNVGNLPSGLYHCVVATAHGVGATSVLVQGR